MALLKTAEDKALCLLDNTSSCPAWQERSSGYTYCMKIFLLVSNLTGRVAACGHLIAFGEWGEGKAGINLIASVMNMPSNGQSYIKSR